MPAASIHSSSYKILCCNLSWFIILFGWGSVQVGKMMTSCNVGIFRRLLFAYKLQHCTLAAIVHTIALVARSAARYGGSVAGWLLGSAQC